MSHPVSSAPLSSCDPQASAATLLGEKQTIDLMNWCRREVFSVVKVSRGFGMGPRAFWVYRQHCEMCCMCAAIPPRVAPCKSQSCPSAQMECITLSGITEPCMAHWSMFACQRAFRAITHMASASCWLRTLENVHQFLTSHRNAISRFANCHCSTLSAGFCSHSLSVKRLAAL